MKKANEDYILNNALCTFGLKAQTTVAMEEMSELTKELCKWQRGQGVPEHICEEIADVQIMLDQMTIAFDRHGMIAKIREEKLKRLEGLITDSE